MKIGIIGFGNIGKMIAHKLEPVYGRINISYFDIKKIRTQYHKAKTITELVDWSDLIFICVKPQILPAVFLEAKHQDKIFVSTVAAIYSETYYESFGKIKFARIIPSMVNEVGGSVLVCYGKYLPKIQKSKVNQVISLLGNIFAVKEKEIDAFTHIASCSPAIFAEIIRLYIGAIAKDGGISEKKSLQIFINMLEALLPILKKDGFKIISRVCTKGGITEEGVKIVAENDASLFRKMSASSFKKMASIRKQLG